MRTKDFQKEKFKAWLLERGADWRAPTNEWELARFWTHEGIGIVYRNSKDKVTFVGTAGAAFHAFKNNLSWRALPRPKDKRQERWQQWVLLSERDGPFCVYCGNVELTYETYTLEHFLARTSGGSSYYANLGLACASCNREMGHLPVAQKIQAAIMRRLKNATAERGAGRALQGAPSSANPAGLHNGQVEQPGREKSGRVYGGDGCSVEARED